MIDGNATLIKACATKPDMYFNVQQASQLNTRVQLDRAEPRQPAHRQIAVTGYRPGQSSRGRHFCAAVHELYRLFKHNASVQLLRAL